MRGQGSTEYVVVIAIVLGIVMMTFSILGFFSGFTEGARLDESQAYWSNAARPFALIDWKYQASPAKLYLKVQNKAGSQLNLSSIVFSNRDISLSLDSGFPAQLQPGAIASPIYSSSPSCEAGKTYEFDIWLNYTTPSVVNLTQLAVKPFIVRCTT